MSLAHLLWSLTGSIESPMICVPLVEFGLQLRHVPELGVHTGVKSLGCENRIAPFVPDPFVETDLSLGGFRREVRRFVAMRTAIFGLRLVAGIIRPMSLRRLASRGLTWRFRDSANHTHGGRKRQFA